MIVVEGPDNSGKTTLVTQLVGQGLTVLRRERFKPGQEGTIGVSYINCLCVTLVEGHYGVVDRCLASEVIYGDLFRGGHRITKQEHRTIIRLLQSHKAQVIFCDPGDQAIVSSWHRRAQLYDRDPLKIAQAYRERMASIFSPIDVLHYDWTLPNSFPQLLERISI